MHVRPSDERTAHPAQLSRPQHVGRSHRPRQGFQALQDQLHLQRTGRLHGYPEREDNQYSRCYPQGNRLLSDADDCGRQPHHGRMHTQERAQADRQTDRQSQSSCRIRQYPTAQPEGFLLSLWRREQRQWRFRHPLPAETGPHEGFFRGL